MSEVKILDCTLRDGGYINNWDFKHKNICKILEKLVSAGLDYVECGFLTSTDYNIDKTLFSSVNQLETLIPTGKTKYTLMINYHDFLQMPECHNKNIFLRVAFKKDKCLEAMEYCNHLTDKGYEIFINPMHTNIYSTGELNRLIKLVNQIKPHGFTFVDTTGSMVEKDVIENFELIDNILDKSIAFCFHSHNNLQLSFSNAQCLLKICKNRGLIIDSSVLGMGRGAGNLSTELLAKYINENYGGNYNIEPIIQIIDEQITPIFEQTPWGYSLPYYLTALNRCHPNYATYLVNKHTVPAEFLNELLKNIPNNNKLIYNEKVIEKIYSENQNIKR